MDEAVQLVDDGTDRSGFYVGATRGRYTNQTALVAEDADPYLARRQIEDILAQPGADTGWRVADLAAKADRERMGDLVDLPSRHVPPISGGPVAEAAEQIARDTDWPDEVRDPHLYDKALAYIDELEQKRALEAAQQEASLEQLCGRLATSVDNTRQAALRDAWLAEPQPRETADPARAIIDLINDDRQLADLTTPSQWHTIADATNPDDLVWRDSDKRWLWGLRRPLLGWLGQQADRLAGDPQWHDGADQLTSRWTTIEQDAETRHAQLKPTRPATEMRINPHREPPRLSPPGPDLSPGW